MWAPSGTGEAASCQSLRKEQAQDEQKTGLRLEQNQGRERAKLMFSIIWTWISMKNPFSSVVGYWIVILESPLWFYENPFPTCRRTLVMKVLPWSGGPLELAQFPHGTSSGSNTAVLQKVNCSAGSTWWGRSRACCRPWLPLLGPASSLPPITFLSFSSVQSLSCVWLFVTPWTHARLLCPSPTPGVCSSSSPLSPWCHLTISSSVVPFSSCLQSFPASGSFPMSQFFASGGQRIGVTASTSVLPMNIQDLFPLGWTGWISFQFKGLSRVLSNTTIQKHQFFGVKLSLWFNSHIHTWILEKP